jgi:hypothetical protein
MAAAVQMVLLVIVGFQVSLTQASLARPILIKLQVHNVEVKLQFRMDTMVVLVHVMVALTQQQFSIISKEVARLALIC